MKLEKNYEEIAKISITPVNITQELHRFSISLKKEIAEQLKSSRNRLLKTRTKGYNNFKNRLLYKLRRTQPL